MRQPELQRDLQTTLAGSKILREMVSDGGQGSGGQSSKESLVASKQARSGRGREAGGGEQMADQRMTDNQRIDARSLKIDAHQLARKLLDQAHDLQAAARTMRDDAREILISVGMDEEEIEEVFKNKPMQ